MSPIEFASGLAVRYLNEQRVGALRDAYFSFRTSLWPVLRLIHGTFDTAALREHLEARVGNDFEILMVHSSVNHMHPAYTGTPLELVRMLIDWCGPHRTLAMPAFYFGDADIGGAYATFKQKPRFDLRRTPSQMGLATELFRRTPGVVQSRHPVYRISALGPLAAALTAGHEFAATPAGLGTPFDFMARHNTRIIGIGKPMQVLTQAHHVEQAMGDEFPVTSWSDEPIDMVVVDRGEEIPVRLPGQHYNGRFNIWKLRKIMDAQRLQEWNFHHVQMFATRADDVTQSLMAAARRGVTLYEPHRKEAAVSAIEPSSEWERAPSVICSQAQQAFETKAHSMALLPHHPWIGGYVDYEWEHMRHIARTLPVDLRGSRVLEFGCNVGASAILYAHFGANVSGIDITPDMVELARLNAARFGQTDIDFQCVADTRQMPYRDGEFDLVVCNSVLEYVDPLLLGGVQREIDRVVKPGGLILVTGSSNRLWPFEVHSGRWGFNYVPRAVDRWRHKTIERGVWPWKARYGFGAHYDNLDTPHHENYFNQSRSRMGTSPRQLRSLLHASSLMRVAPGLLAQSVSCLLKKRG